MNNFVVYFPKWTDFGRESHKDTQRLLSECIRTTMLSESRSDKHEGKFLHFINEKTLICSIGK